MTNPVLIRIPRDRLTYVERLFRAYDVRYEEVNTATDGEETELAIALAGSH